MVPVEDIEAGLCLRHILGLLAEAGHLVVHDVVVATQGIQLLAGALAIA